MRFKYYVLNYNHNTKEIENFNIFDNYYVQTRTEKEVKKYLSAPSKYKYETYNKIFFGFEAFCEKLDSIIMCEEWSRYEYEISVGRPFESNSEILEKWDCYRQCKPNIEMIAREVIFQYKNANRHKT